MQIKILNDFIDIYNETYNKKFDDSFNGKIDFIKSKLNEPFMHLGDELKRQIDLIDIKNNINIAIIGQFSSGKSTLLNLILKKNCLPTGVIPVTFKPTYLKYAKDYFLMVEYENGKCEIVDIDELAKYTDQRTETIKTKSLSIYAPIELLKDITFVDTPGLNANDLDNFSAINEFKQAHFLIWLSLVDNAGKQSEKQILTKLINKKAICLLNQKDKLNQDELKNVLSYANDVFGDYFDKIIAISCKEALDENTYKNSNFDEFLFYLEKLDKEKLKQEFIINKFSEIFNILEKQYNLFFDIFDFIFEKLNNFGLLLDENKLKFQSKINILNNQFLKDVKSISEKISKDIFSNIKEKEFHFYKKNTILKNTFKRYSYKAPFIEQKIKFDTQGIAKAKNDTFLKFENLKEDLKKIYEIFENDIFNFKAKFSNIQKNDILESEYDFAELRSFSNLSDELFLKEFKEELFKVILELDLLFEKISSKTFLNYENVVKFCILYFSDKINKSKEFYEFDNTKFYIYYPKVEEIYESILNELNFYEFEALLLQRSQILKITELFLKKYNEILDNKKELIKNKKEKFNKRLKLILDLKNSLSN